MEILMATPNYNLQYKRGNHKHIEITYKTVRRQTYVANLIMFSDLIPI